MVIDPSGRTLTRLGRLVGDGTESVSDADLVRRYVNARDGTAFAALVRRHGPMVFGVCRRALGHVQDAEDAFQATFLILARKADRFRPERVGHWLYGVAVRVANKARVRRTRRMLVERGVEHAAEPAAPPDAPSLDWLPMLDAALAKLSDRDRRPILLCDLMGRSRAEAATELGIAEGTLSSRLARSRDKLRARLARLGAALSLPTLATGLSDEASATVPPSLIQSTIAAGTSAPSARALAEGVMRTMLLAKITKVAAVGVCVLGTVTAGIIWLPTAGGEPVTVANETPKGAPPAKEAAKPDSDIARIQGTWIVESKKSTPPKERRARGPMEGDDEFDQSWDGVPMSFDGDRVDFAGFPGRIQKFQLDSTRTPTWINFIFHDVNRSRFRTGGLERRDVSRPSIYKFEGDKLHIVLGDDELEARPDSFEVPEKSSPFIHVVLRRPTDDERKRLEQSEHAALQGTWIGVFKTTKGEIHDLGSGVKLVVKGDRMRLDVLPADPMHASFALNVATHPWQLDLTATADGGGVKKGQKVAGIIFRQGHSITLALGDTRRPENFDAAGKDGTVYAFIREGTRSNYLSEFARPPKKNPGTAAPKADNSRLRELQQERVKALEVQLQGQFERVKIGKDPLIHFIEAVRELADARLDVAETHDKRLAAVEEMVKSFREIEEQIVHLQEAGLQTKQGVAQIKAARLKAEIQLEKLKAEK